MAELGAAASVVGLVSLGLQLAECAVKLKKFCDQVEKAPEALRTLEIEIKLFSLLLQDVDAFRVQRGITPSASLLQCIYHCQIVAAKIVNYVREIEGISKKYKLPGRVYATLRLSDVNSLCRDMERAKTNLIIALQLLTTGLPAISVGVSQIASVDQPQIAQCGPSTTQIAPIGYHEPLEEPPDFVDDGPSEEQDEATNMDSELPTSLYQVPRTTKGQTRKFARSQQIFKIRIGLPWLFGQAVWDFSVRRSYQGWEVSLQSQNIVPYDSPVIDYVKRGDVLAVRKLFAEGKASPYDCIDAYKDIRPLFLLRPYPMNALSRKMYAIILSHMQVSHQASTAQTVLDHNLLFGEIYSPHDMDTFSTLVNIHDIDVLDLEHNCIYQFASTKPSLVQRNLEDFGHVWTCTDWFDCFWSGQTSYSWEMTFCDPPAFVDLCSQGTGVEALASLRSSEGISVIHFIAGHIARLLNLQEDTSEWSRILTSIIDSRGGPALLNLVSAEIDGYHGLTPFMEFLRSCNRFQRLRQALRFWQKLLSSTSTSIISYLEREMAIWKRYNHSLSFDCKFHSKMRLNGVYADALTREWRGHYVVPIQLYGQQTAVPGAWPIPPYVPQTICWSPRESVVGSTEDDWDRLETACTIQLRDAWLAEAPAELGGHGRIWRWRPSRTREDKYGHGTSYDDEDSHDALSAPKRSLRRSRSEPRGLPQAYTERSRLFAGGLRYCTKHTRWNLQNDLEHLWPPRLYDGCDDERCCNRVLPSHDYQLNARKRALAFELVRKLRDFIKVHGVWPSRCGHWRPWHIENAILEANDILGYATFEWIESPLCEEFPHCEHQEIYLESLQQEIKDDERGLCVARNGSFKIQARILSSMVSDLIKDGFKTAQGFQVRRVAIPAQGKGDRQHLDRIGLKSRFVTLQLPWLHVLADGKSLCGLFWIATCFVWSDS